MRPNLNVWNTPHTIKTTTFICTVLNAKLKGNNITINHRDWFISLFTYTKKGFYLINVHLSKEECCVVRLFRAALNLDISTWEGLSRSQGIKLIILSRIHLVIWIWYINIVWWLIRGEMSVILISYSVLLLQPISATRGAGVANPSGAHDFTPVFSGVRVARSLVLCEMFCRSLFVLLVFAIVLSVLQFKVSDYPFWYLQAPRNLFDSVLHLGQYFYIPVAIKAFVPAHTRTCISICISRGLFVFNDLKWEIIVRFCWYWWTCWLSLFKLYFTMPVLVHILTNNKENMLAKGSFILTLRPEFTSNICCCWVFLLHVARSLVFCVVFCLLLFILLSHFFWTLYCLYFNLWLLL